MEIETDLAGTHFFPNPKFIQVFFEAVANSLDAGADCIDIAITADDDIQQRCLEIVIRDNGEGLTDDRWRRFQKITTPVDEFHKGLGRLVYIRYFDRVEVESRYGDKRRRAVFSPTFAGDSEVDDHSSEVGSGTTLHFNGFTRDRLHTYDHVRPGVLKRKLLEHFLPALLERKSSGASFQLNITLTPPPGSAQNKLFADRDTLTISDVPEFKTRCLKDQTVDAYESIQVHYMVDRESGATRFTSAISVDGRTIPYPLLKDDAMPAGVAFTVFFKSDLFSGRSDSARQRLTLPAGISESLLRERLLEEVSALLSEEVPEIEARNSAVRESFEAQYPHLVGLFKESSVGLVGKDEAIREAQMSFLTQQRRVLEADVLDEQTFRRSLEMSARTLTEYVLYRETIIRRLGDMAATNQEAEIHNLLVPRYEKFERQGLADTVYRNNAWLLDDRFMSFRTILSEKRMNELIASVGGAVDADDHSGRPDISLIFSADPDTEQAVDVVVVELKRRFDEDKENINAVTQLAARAQALVKNCPSIQRMWYFAVIDISDALAALLTTLNWIPMFSRGRMFYQELGVILPGQHRVPTPTHILSYATVIKDAAARNHTFLEVLKRDIQHAVVAHRANAQDAATRRDSSPTSQ